jgi:ferric iron reductase protein FhuF
MHPLIGTLTELSDKELAEKLSKVMRVMRSAGSINGTIYNQAYMIYQSLVEEQQKRYQKTLEEQIRRAGGVNFDDIINIG